MRFQDEPHFTEEETEAQGGPSRLHCIAGRTTAHSGKSQAAFSFWALAIMGKHVNPSRAIVPVQWEVPCWLSPGRSQDSPAPASGRGLRVGA